MVIIMNRIILSCLSLFLTLELFISPVFAAVDRTFGSGSLIIPMDGSVYQPSGDGGIYESYGFIYKLLSRKSIDGITPDPIPVYWIIDDQKTSITADDLLISHTVTNPVAKEHKAGGEITIAGVGTSIGYSGGPFVIDVSYAPIAKALWADGFQDVNLHVSKVPFTASVQREMFGVPPKLALMNDNEARTGNATKILESYLKIAGIVNPVADVNGNPCDGTPVSGDGCIYDVLTPLEVAGIKTLTGLSLNGKSMLFDYTCPGCSTKPKSNYSVLWVPHWVGYEDYLSTLGSYVSFNPAVGAMPSSEKDVHDVVMAIRDFVDSGNSLFAECASIETFEWSKYGHFLTKYDIGHDGGTNDPLFTYYNKDALDQPFVQVGSFTFEPQGGHLHNWRPFQSGDITTLGGPVPMAFNPSVSNPKMTYNQTNTGYDGTVTVFTYDDPSVPSGTIPAPDVHDYKDLDSAKQQWHYYVGGNMDGDPTNGYVVYLGGHSYVQCAKAGGGTTGSPDHETRLTFNQDMNGETNLDMNFEFKVGGTNYNLTVNDISAANITTKSTTYFDLKLDLSSAAFSPDGKQISGIHLVNLNASNTLDVKKLTASWDKSGAKLEDIFDITENTNVEDKPGNDYPSGKKAKLKAFKIDSGATGDTSGSGGYLSGCSPKGTSGAGIRYVLNTIFRLDAVKDREFVRSSPIVFNDFLYQGSFDYPSFSGHFRKFQVNADLGVDQKGLKLNNSFGSGGDAAPLLTTETAYFDINGNKLVDANELTGRDIFASTETGFESGVVLKSNNMIKEFKFENADLFKSRMSVFSPLDLSETQGVISRRYGMMYDLDLLAWVKKENVFGGIEHSSPIIIGPSILSNITRPIMAYVGGLDGMIHAIKAGVKKAASGSDPGEISGAGEVLWSFIPSNQLPRLQFFRDPNAISTFPAVDASLAFSEVPDPNIPDKYLTVLLATMGVGGNGILALDVTNPTSTTPAKPKLLWERSGVNTATGAIIMGNGSKVAIGKVKNRSGQVEYRAYVTTALKQEKKSCQNASGIPLNDGSLCGGIQVFTFDLLSGDQKWRFERVYTSSLNNIPGSLSLVDVDQNGFEDYVAIGDMEGNLWILPTIPDYDNDGAEDIVIMADSTFDDNISGSGNIITDINPLYAPSRDESPCLTYPSAPTSCYGVGHDNPITASPTVITQGGRTTLVWGTGGADWASDTDFYSVYILDITSVNVYHLPTEGGILKSKLLLDQGEKIFGAITSSEGSLFFGTAFGQVEGINPKDDVALINKGNIRGIQLSDPNVNWKYTANGKFRGSVFISKGQLYATTLDGKIIDIGDGTFGEPSALNWYNVKTWREIFDLNTNQ